MIRKKLCSLTVEQCLQFHHIHPWHVQAEIVRTSSITGHVNHFKYILGLCTFSKTLKWTAKADVFIDAWSFWVLLLIVCFFFFLGKGAGGRGRRGQYFNVWIGWDSGKNE